MQQLGLATVGLIVALVWAPCLAAEPQTAGPPAGPGPAVRRATTVDLPTALRWTLERNPQLLAIRQQRGISAAALAAARLLPTTFNPAVSVDVRPWTFDAGGQSLQTQVSVTMLQPLPWPGQTGRRVEVARASYDLTQWRIVQAELLALLTTYRLHQTAVFRREQLALAEQLSQFNRQLVQALERQVQAGQSPPADLVMAQVEQQTSVQQRELDRQQYVEALTELRKQLGLPQLAEQLTVAGPLTPLEPGDQPGRLDELVQLAVSSRPDVLAAQAEVAASAAAVRLARLQRLPTAEVGPVYEHDESGTTFYGLAVGTPVPVWNSGAAAVREKEAEHWRDLAQLDQLRVRAETEVRAAWARWQTVRRQLETITGVEQAIQQRAAQMERLYRAGQADFISWLTVRRSLITASSGRLEMLWKAAQASADVLEAAGASPLLGLPAR